MNGYRSMRVGSAVFAVTFFMTILLPAQSVTTLDALSSKMGGAPKATLVQGTDGVFYGTTEYDGAYGGGTVIRVTRNGSVKVLYSFCAQPNCRDGQYPISALVQAIDGQFYGTTSQGGASNAGTIFKMTLSGKLTTLYSFCAKLGCSDGSYATSPLIQGTDGNLYGETVNGGAFGGGCGTYGCGTLFKITVRGALTTLYTFCVQPDNNCTDGELPSGGLIQGKDGNFYGTTSSDGNSATCPNGCGTVFKLSPRGELTTLYTFCSQQNCADGTGPQSGVIEGSDGNLYGTTSGGGMQSCGPYGLGCGTAFKITSKGKLTTLHTFDNTDGAQVWAGLEQGTDGKFYGTTYSGGTNNNCFGTCGTIFKMSPAGIVNTLYEFCSQTNCTDGDNPLAALIQGTDGRFYGTTFQGGLDSVICTFGCGTVFSLNVGLHPFVEPRPRSGTVNSRVVILGNDLTGAMRVSFNGTLASFKVVSSTEITTTVPDRATSGKITVKTPGGTLSSNVTFLVTPASP